MTAAAVLAGVAAACGVLALWELAVVAERLAAAGGVARVLAPWREAGRRGVVATADDARRLSVVAAVASGAAGWLLWGPAGAAVVGCASPLLVGRALSWRRRRWRDRAADGAAVVARSMADALAAGHSISGAIVATASAGSAGAEADEAMRGVAAAVRMGEPVDVALAGLCARTASPAYEVLVAAILLQREAGGDLAGLLRDLAADLEHARRSAHDARAATAQARFTAGLVCALPAGAAALAELASPGAITAMVSAPLPAMLVAVAGLLDAVAFAAVRRLSRVAG